MKKGILLVMTLSGIIFLSSCGKDEECVCTKIANITESDAKDAGVSLDTACELAQIGDESCKIE